MGITFNAFSIGPSTLSFLPSKKRYLAWFFLWLEALWSVVVLCTSDFLWLVTPVFRKCVEPIKNEINYLWLDSSIWFILILNLLSDWHNLKDYINLGDKFVIITLKTFQFIFVFLNKLYRINHWVNYFLIHLSTTGILCSERNFFCSTRTTF